MTRQAFAWGAAASGIILAAIGAFLLSKGQGSPEGPQQRSPSEATGGKSEQSGPPGLGVAQDPMPSGDSIAPQPPKQPAAVAPPLGTVHPATEVEAEHVPSGSTGQSAKETELKALVERLAGEDPEAVALLVGEGDAAVVAILEKLGQSSENYQLQHRAVMVLRKLATAESQAALSRIALDQIGQTNVNLRAWAASNFIKNLASKTEASGLLQSKDAKVQTTALEALQGQPIDGEVVSRLAELMQSEAFSVRWRSMSVLGSAPEASFATERVATVVRSIVGVEELPGAQEKAPVLARFRLTKAEQSYAHCIESLVAMRGADDALKQLAPIVRGRQEYCILIALARRGDESAKAGVVRILGDHDAGILRAYAAAALGEVGTEADLPLLQNLRASDQFALESQDDVGSAQTVYPVRLAAAEAIARIDKRSR